LIDAETSDVLPVKARKGSDKAMSYEACSRAKFSIFYREFDINFMDIRDTGKIVL
jgi:hypothetical protein